MTTTPDTYVSITDAAKMAGISRQTMYNKYINAGVITVKRVNDEPKIDVSDLIRVFGSIKWLQPDAAQDGQDITEINIKQCKDLVNELKAKLNLLEQENALLKERMSDKDQHLADLRRGFELIEHSSGQKRGFWGKLFG